MKILVFSIFTIILFTGKPVSDLKVNKTPIPKTVETYSRYYADREYFVYLSDDDIVKYEKGHNPHKYRDLPFDIDHKIFPPRTLGYSNPQSRVKTDDGWIVGFDAGEFGGSLYWFNEDGTESKLIMMGNIKGVFLVNDILYVMEGLDHLMPGKGKMFGLKKEEGNWEIIKTVGLPEVPCNAVMTPNNEFIIISSEKLIKATIDYKIKILVDKGFWGGLLPNSIVLKDDDIFVGMRGGILKAKLTEPEKQVWLVEKSQHQK